MNLTRRTCSINVKAQFCFLLFMHFLSKAATTISQYVRVAVTICIFGIHLQFPGMMQERENHNINQN